MEPRSGLRLQRHNIAALQLDGAQEKFQSSNIQEMMCGFFVTATSGGSYGLCS
jgi:hypothetical protein